MGLKPTIITLYLENGEQRRFEGEDYRIDYDARGGTIITMWTRPPADIIKIHPAGRPWILVTLHTPPHEGPPMR